MSKYGYAGKKLGEKLKAEARQKQLEDERRENQRFCSQLLLGGCCFGLFFIITLLYFIFSSGSF